MTHHHVARSTATGADTTTSCIPGSGSVVDGRVSLQSRRSFRSAKYQPPSIFANVSRYRSEAIMILRLPSSGRTNERSLTCRQSTSRSALWRTSSRCFARGTVTPCCLTSTSGLPTMSPSGATQSWRVSLMARCRAMVPGRKSESHSFRTGSRQGSPNERVDHVPCVVLRIERGPDQCRDQ
jgi:hypothetical protein